MDSRERLLGCIGLAYQAAHDASLWPRALAALAEALGGTGALIGVVDTARQETASIDSGFFAADRRQSYKSHYFHLNPRSRLSARMPAGAIFFDAMVGEAAALERNPYYGDFLQRNGHRYFIAANLENDGRRRINLTVQRLRAAGHVQAREIAFLDRALPHVRAAFALSLEMGRLRETARLTRTAPPGSVASLVTDGHGRVLLAAHDAEERIAGSGVLTLSGGQLGAADPALARALSRAIAAAARLAAGEASETPQVLAARGPQAARIHVTPHPFEDLPGLRQPAVCVALVPMARPRLESGAALAALFGLTPAEQALALALVTGARLKEFAAARGVSINTARSQLAQLRLKTGARTQAGIVRRLLSDMLA